VSIPESTPPAGARPAGNAPPSGFARLSTEAVRHELDHLDELDAAGLVALMSLDSRRATEAVAAAAPSLSAAVEVVSERLAGGGRLVYVGAGSAGRLALLDAAELGPTFNVPAGKVEAVLAGGEGAMRHSSEGAEDDWAAGVAALEHLEVSGSDVVVGISASGRTPFVLAAIEHARSVGAVAIGISCNAGSPLSMGSDIAVELVVGGEVIAGSSRLNAGTAQKIALNTISTAAMVRLGKTYGNLMVDLRANNTKLRDRAVRIVQTVTGVGPEPAAQALSAAGWSVKLACLTASSGQDLATVVPVLEAAGGRLRQALAAMGRGAAGAMVPAAPAAGAEPIEATGGGEARPACPAGAMATPSGGARITSRWKRLGVGAAFVDGMVVPGDVAVDEGVLVAVGLPGTGTAIAIPGLVDLQVNGYAGVDVASASVEDLGAMGAALARDGVLAYQPTLISGDPDLIMAATARVAEFANGHHARTGDRPGHRARPGLYTTGGYSAHIVGVHLEGPFLSPERPGTHPLEWLRAPDPELLRMLLGAGPVTMMTLAPELPGALELVEQLARRGTVVSLGHSAATAEEAAEAVRAGASVVTHLFNAMSPVSSRSPGLAGLALSDKRVRIQLIADGGHLADELVRLAFEAAPGRCSIVTDATSLAGRGEGQLMIGDVPITLSGGVARRPDGTIAGGASTLLSGLRRLSGLSVGLTEALSAVTEGPARALRRADIGHLRQGGPANLVVLDDRFELRDVLMDGRSIGPA
jgi:N-acetylglucosamine-6-phosphate deacetylase